jgi:hypothetical protein
LSFLFGFFSVSTEPLEREERSAALLQPPVGTVQTRALGTKQFGKCWHVLVVIESAVGGDTALFCLGTLVNTKLRVKWAYLSRLIKGEITRQLNKWKTNNRNNKINKLEAV